MSTIEASIIRWITQFLLICLGVFAAQAQTVYVPSHHWVYDFLDRLEAKRVLPVVLNGTRPMTRAEIAGHVALLIDHPELNRVEREQLAYLRFEFQEELQAKGDADYPSRLRQLSKSRWVDPWLPDFVCPKGRHLLEVEHGPLRAHWDPIFLRSRMRASDDTLNATESVNIDANGFLLWGTLGKSVGFYTDVRDTREWGTRRYPSGNTTAPRLGFVQGNTRQIYHDETVAYLLLQRRWASLMFGKDFNLWGPARAGQLMLSDHAAGYDQLKLQVTLPRVKFTSMIAWLRAFTPDYYIGGAGGRMMAAHRLEFAPFRWVDIGLQETLIYAGRQFEPAYANPFMFFRSAEHYLGDQDNAAMGLDAELKLLPKTKLYGELFIDDLTTGRLGSDFYGNKYGVTLGFFCVDALLPQLDLRCEYSRLRPFVYSHKDAATRYMHFSTTLGHWIGPNSDYLLGELSYRLSRRAVFRLQFDRLRHGANDALLNAGGDPSVPHEAANDSENALFLAGVVETTSRLRLSASYELIRNFFLEIQGSLSDFDSQWPQFSDVNPAARPACVLGLSWNHSF